MPSWSLGGTSIVISGPGETSLPSRCGPPQNPFPANLPTPFDPFFPAFFILSFRDWTKSLNSGYFGSYKYFFQPTPYSITNLLSTIFPVKTISVPSVTWPDSGSAHKYLSTKRFVPKTSVLIILSLRISDLVMPEYCHLPRPHHYF